MTPAPGSSGGETKHASTPSQKMSVNLTDGSLDNPRRFQLGMSECVETKTITTTTRLTRKFPQVFVDNPIPLESLDVKEYPLAMKPTPPEIADFSYRMPIEYTDTQDPGEALFPSQSASDDYTPIAPKAESPSDDVAAFTRPSHDTLRSPSEGYPRRSRQTRSSKTANGPSSTSESHPSSQRPTRHCNTMIAVTNELRRSIARGNSGQAGLGDGAGAGSSRQDGPRPAGFGSGFLATPDASDMADGGANRQLSSRPRTLQLDRSRHSSEPSTAQDEDSTSPVPSESQTIFGSNVATPPITDADVEPFADDDLLRLSSRSILHPRPSVDVVAAQDASLPSPRLSPTLAAAQLHSNDEEPESQERADYQVESANQNGWADDSQMTEDAEGMSLVRAGVQSSDSQALERRPRISDDNSVVVDPHMLLEAFDSMKPEMQTYMMYQFLRRCARPTLRIVANAVNPALKCDFFFQLPLELSYHVLSYLDHRDLCRAAQVSRHWRNIVDRNETGWRELFDRDGYKLPPGELIKAINQGWGWQDPVGAMGFERDLSMHSRLTSSEHDLTRSLRTDAAPRLRTSKRKRGLTTYSASERSKRRASVLETASAAQTEVRQHKSAGPLSAANAAATAVPDPNLGLPSLRQLHLYKSLYRRHHMMRESWTSGEVKPAHVAFAAHPRHVITCLQFDDDKIITGSDDTFIHVYDTKTGKLRKKLAGHEGGVWALQYEGNILVSGSTDRSVRVWDIEAGLCQQVFYGHTSTVRCLQILTPVETGKDSAGKPIMQPEKPLIITGSRDSFLRVWRLPEVGSKRYYQAGLPAQESECPYFIRALSGHTHSVRAISAHGDTLVSGSYDSVVRVWRISTGECLHVLHGHTQKVYSVVLDHERNRCISGSMDSLVKIWDLATGACLFTLEGHNLLVGLLDLRDERLVSAAADSTLRIWDPETGRCKNTLMAHTGAITCFQHDGQKVISGSEKTVKMWDVKTGECIQDLLTDLSGVWQVKFDGRRCVAAVQRDQLTYVEILDFGAVRDGQPPEELGRRILLDGEEVQAIIEEDA